MADGNASRRRLFFFLCKVWLVMQEVAGGQHNTAGGSQGDCCSLSGCGCRHLREHGPGCSHCALPGRCYQLQLHRPQVSHPTTAVCWSALSIVIMWLCGNCTLHSHLGSCGCMESAHCMVICDHVAEWKVHSVFCGQIVHMLLYPTWL